MRIPTQISELSLRSFEATDRASLVQHGNNRAVWRNLTDQFPHPYTLADADFFIDFATNGDDRLFHLAIDWQGEFIGSIGITKGRSNKAFTGAMGYWLGETYWGRGIATAAVSAITAHAFGKLQLLRIEASVLSWNAASARVLEKNGFLHEGTQRMAMHKDSSFADLLLYGKLRDS